MVDPRVLVRLDMVIGLLGIIAVLLALRLVIRSPGIGFPAVLVLGVASVIAMAWYRRAFEAAAG